MSKPMFHAGEAYVVDGVNFRVREGFKSADDLVLEWQMGERWIPITIGVLFFLVDFICENEDRLYPHPAKGGEYTMQALRSARVRGWRQAWNKLQMERAAKDERRLA